MAQLGAEWSEVVEQRWMVSAPDSLSEILALKLRRQKMVEDRDKSVAADRSTEAEAMAKAMAMAMAMSDEPCQ